MMFVLSLFLVIFQARAELQALPDKVPFQPKPVFSTDIPCTDLVRHIEEYRQFRNDSDLAVTNFVEQLNGAVDNWVTTLKPLEDKTTVIETGFFKPIEDGSKSLKDSVPLLYQNSDYFDAHLKDVIVPAIEKCLEEKASDGRR